MLLLGTHPMKALASLQIITVACIAMSPLCCLLEATGEQQNSNLAYQVLSAAAACSLDLAHVMPTLLSQVEELRAAMAFFGGRQAAPMSNVVGVAVCQSSALAAWVSRLLGDTGTHPRVIALLRASGQCSTAQLLEVYRQAVQALQGMLVKQGECRV